MNSNRILIIISLIAIIKVNGDRSGIKTVSNQLRSNVDERKGNTNIDSLREKYIQLESALWTVIDNRIEQNETIKQINDVHLQFFTERFGEIGVWLTVLDPLEMTLWDSISQINLTVRTLRDRYLRPVRTEQDKRLILSFTEHAVNLTGELDKLFGSVNELKFLDSIKERSERRQCDDKDGTIISAPSQLLYEYYTEFSAAELKAYAVLQLSYMFRTVLMNENLSQQSLDLRTSFKDRTVISQSIVRHLIVSASRHLWKCDPTDYNGSTHQVTRFLQGYIDNEVNLNGKNNCKKSCSDYRVSRNEQCNPGTYCGRDVSDTTRRCGGTVVGCKFLESTMEICPAFYNPTRRYDQIVLGSGTVLGKENYCGSMEKTESWIRWFVQCSNCFCYCDEIDNRTDRYFSLHNVVSNIAQNMIITGVSIIKQNQVFHLKISERKLGARGQIEDRDPMWHPWKMENYFRVTDAEVSDSIDYFTLTWSNRSIDLVPVIVPYDHIVTGVRFSINHRSHLELQVQGSRFNFETGSIYPQTCRWFTAADNSAVTEINPIESDIPTRTISKSIPDERTDAFIQFGPTDVYLDAAQTTIPFIDGQFVTPANPIPLSGVGLYYKSQPGFGGFIAPKLFVYDFSEHIYTK